MEIRTNKNSFLSVDEDGDINEALDVIVCAMILEGWNVNTIHDALIGKAESMEKEFVLRG